MAMKKILCIALFMMVICAAADAQPVIALPDWQVIVEAGVSLEYQPGMEAVARQLLPELVKIVDEIPDEVPLIPRQQRINIEYIGAHQTECLQYMASMLGLEKPGIKMTDTFDGMSKIQQAVAAGELNIRSFRLWDYATMLRILRSGGLVEGITYNKETDSCTATISMLLNNENPTTPYSSQIPLRYNRDEPLQSTIESARRIIMTYAEAMYTGWGEQPYMIFLIAAGMGINNDVKIDSAFRRWFCDGVTQYVAEQAALQFVGQDAYERLQEFCDPEQY